MPSKTQFYAQLAAETARGLTDSLQTWTAFLETSARLYKYPYYEQLLIFAQKPEATACAGYEVWNETMNRYVRRGTKGIALIDSSGDTPRMKYVFDVSDTGGGANARRPFLWEYRPEHRDSVTTALEQRFGQSGSISLAFQLEAIAGELIESYWEEHQRDILGIVDGSFLEEYDEDNLRAVFKHAGTVSAAYMMMSRCGLDHSNYFTHEDFQPIFDFNTPRPWVSSERRSARPANRSYDRSKSPSRDMSASIARKGRKTMSELNYRANGDYLIPDLSLSETAETPLGKYGRMRKTYLREHRPVLFSNLLLSEKLYPHLREIDKTAQSRLETMMPKLMEAAGISEKLKAEDPMRWVGLMNNCKAQAEETILRELVYS